MSHYVILTEPTTAFNRRDSQRNPSVRAWALSFDPPHGAGFDYGSVPYAKVNAIDERGSILSIRMTCVAARAWLRSVPREAAEFELRRHRTRDVSFGASSPGT